MQLSQKILKRLGNRTLAMIEENIAAGVDYKGNAYHYSEESFYHPYTMELAQRAYWLNVSGAGRGRKLWKFMGIRKEQQDELIRDLVPDILAETQTFIDKLNFKALH